MLIIINYIRSGKRYACQQDLLNDVNLSMKLRGFREITGKTLERDLKYIEEGFGLTIMFDKGARRYVIIDESTNDEKYEELLCNFDLLNELDKNSPIRSFVLAEHHRPPRSENMILLLKAIQYQHPIQFTYENYRKNTIELVDKTPPHYLKESQGRWYLLTKNNLALITYAVERMSDIEIFWDETFEREINIDVSELFRDCYGIWNSEKYPVEYIELRFSPLDGHFLKSLPLHHSQQYSLTTMKNSVFHYVCASLTTL